MALKSTIFKLKLGYADEEQGRYHEHALTIARHPSENDERMMIRVLAFALFADKSTVFGKGLSDVDEPDIVTRDDTGAITHWIEVGQPDERTMLRAAGKAARVSVLAYSSSSEMWWRGVEAKVDRAKNLAVYAVSAGDSQALAGLAQRAMELYCTIAGNDVWVNDGARDLQLTVNCLKPHVPR
jgi:uncharacterized protein YaeQ